MEHTKGKWRVLHGTMGSPYIVADLSDNTRRLIAMEGSFYDEDNPPTLDELEANVKIMAKAPEMKGLILYLKDIIDADLTNGEKKLIKERIGTVLKGI